MRAAGIKALGEPVEIFEVDELAMPAAGEVLIDVVAAGIGNWDELVRIGSWQIGGPAPMPPGAVGDEIVLVSDVRADPTAVGGIVLGAAARMPISFRAYPGTLIDHNK